ncbi:MAG TPA: two-component regulator propeller domain-containing protein [Candidatus Udaeobacter sp.]|nr:two-component regulator propeller domain-containing protein [Candidatus Udaeobacter sp.]
MSPAAPRVFVVLSALMAAGALHSPCRASGAWSTFVRPQSYSALAASAETVWCATGEAGLVVYDRAADRFASITREPGGLASNHLSSLAFDRQGRLWVGTHDAGVSRLSPDGTWGLLNAFDGLPSLDVNAVRADGDTLWIGTTTGLALFDGTEIRGRLPDGVNPSPFASDDITGIVVRGDSLWLSTGAGVYYGSISAGLASWTSIATGLPAGPVDALVSDGNTVWALAGDRLWRAQAGDTWASVPGFHSIYHVSDDFGTVIASSDSGLFQYSGGAWAPINPSLVSFASPQFTFATTVDDAGHVFAANSGGFYEQQQGPTPWIQRYPPGPPGNNVQNVEINHGLTYMATYDEGVGRYDGSSWTLFFPQGCTSDCAETFYDPIFAFGMLADHQGYLWLGTWGVSVDVMNDTPSPSSVQHLWVSTQLSDDRHTWLWSAAADSAGGRWFGMDTPCLGCDQQHDPIGIDFYSANGIFLANYAPGKGDSALNMANNQVRSLAYEAGRMWVGYAGHGVQWFSVPADTTQLKVTFNSIHDADRLDVFSVIPHGDSIWVFNTADLRLYPGFGASNNGIGYAIPAGPAPRGAVHPMDVAPDGTVWLGTANGVRVYHPGGATEDLTAENSPLADDEVRAVRIDRSSGAVWIGTASGLNRFDPGYVAPPPPKLARLDIKVYPNPVPIANLIGAAVHIVGNGQRYIARVFSVDGRLIRRLDGGASNGDIVWDGRDDGGGLVRPGLYFVRVEAGGRTATARVTLLR